MSLERAKLARKGFEGSIRGKVARILFGVPQHASLFSPAVDIPSPTSSVQIFSLDFGHQAGGSSLVFITLFSVYGGGGGY